MSGLTPEQEEQKRFMYETISPRRKKFIDKIGYEKWDPFQKPNDPIDIRTDGTKRTTHQLVREFLWSRPKGEFNSNEFNKGALDFALGIVNKEEVVRGMYEFCKWYMESLKEKGLEEPNWER
ncbi:MAG: hypothetical protein SVS15_07915 [Thermodesulfobacteriota bacterium]|nr:hypothetical protein [Thermodesulfobacteriota bacterium]